MHIRVEDVAHARRELVEATHRAEPDIVLEQLFALGDEEVTEQLHEGLHLGRRTVPVLRAERVERQRVDPEPTAGPDDASHRLRAALVADRTTLTKRRGPPAVAIHDDGDVARKTL